MEEVLRIDEELHDLIPPLTAEEYRQLEENIIAEGCRDALVVWNDTIIDGHNRYEICTQHGIEFNTVGKEFENKDVAKVWIIDNQKGRRNLTDGWKYELAQERKKILTVKGKENIKTPTGGRNCLTLSPNDKVNTRDEIANDLGWSSGKVAQADYVWKHADEKIRQKVKAGEETVKGAYNAVKKQERAQLIDEQRIGIESGAINLPVGVFEIISVDPPWPYGTKYDSAGRRAANPYPEMSLEEITAIELPAADDCILFLWTTHKFMRHSFNILDSWGFRDVAIITWVKDRMGLGTWLRSQSEFCIMAVKGKPTIGLTNQTTIINGPLREHSRKPDEFYNMVDGLCVGRKLDYFSREPRPGWQVFGNDTAKFGGASL
jgi:N6-adenosine-specific RNA methylase IME4